MKLVVVTGCLGFIGSEVTKACLKKGWKVYGIDSKTYAACNYMSFLERMPNTYNFTFLNADIADIKHIPDCDYIINVAAETHVGNSIIDSSDFIKSNIVGVKNLLDILKHKPKNVTKKPVLFHFSTDEVYGDIEEGSHDESASLLPSNPYSASKASADMLINAWARTYGLDYVILRPTNNYGVGQYPEKLIPLVVKQLQRGRKIRLHDHGEPYRNWLHVEDTAQAVIKIIESGVVNEIFNVAGGFEQKNIDTTRKIINSFFNGNHEEEYSEYLDLLDFSYIRKGQDVRYSIDDKKLRDLGWKPKKIFDQEIDKIVNDCKIRFRW